VRGAPRTTPARSTRRSAVTPPIARTSTRARVHRSAVTHWRVEQRLREATLLRIRLETGRTHQIRVHMASIGLPLLGDPVYGGGRALPAARGLGRQALHATLLGFTHPTSGARLRFESPLPEDLRALLEALR
jgi:23S rRNA pseudouridine1911/1915/1917 synthase